MEKEFVNGAMRNMISMEINMVRGLVGMKMG